MLSLVDQVSLYAKFESVGEINLEICLWFSRHSSNYIKGQDKKKEAVNAIFYRFNCCCKS